MVITRNMTNNNKHPTKEVENHQEYLMPMIRETRKELKMLKKWISLREKKRRNKDP